MCAIINITKNEENFMSYTMSYDASVKCKKSDVKGLLHHNARDVDIKNNIYMNHANKCINSDYTEYNQTYYYNQDEEKFIKCTDIHQIYNSLSKRLENVKRPLRRDAVILRSLILQLDPAWYEEHWNEEEREYSYDCMLAWACETFGEKNIISFSIHEDETNPHIHVSFCPVTQDGRLSQKDFIDKNKLKLQHRSLREYMTEKGFEIEMKNRKPGKYARRMSVEEYKDYAELQSEHENLDSAFRYAVKQQNLLDQRKNNLDIRENRLKSKEENFRKQVQEFLKDIKEYQSNISELAQEYWTQPDADDFAIHFMKSMVNKKTGVSFYDLYQNELKKETIRVKKELEKRNVLLDKFSEIARKAKENDYSTEIQFY